MIKAINHKGTFQGDVSGGRFRGTFHPKGTFMGPHLAEVKRLLLVRPLLVLIALVLLFASPVLASDTMLMFVGEDLEVLSLASRREEAAWNAPAIADVITKEDIDNAGDATIADLLGKTAGFYINEKEQGSVPYLRGIPDSVLFLYDTVPFGSGASKSFNNIDNEISLASVKRIEIIRGAGSVLWGPDAFAGVVNVVPFTGKDFQGVETGAGASSLDESRSAFLKYGVDRGQWNSFVSVSAKSAKEDDRTFNVVKFWNDGEAPSELDERFGEDTTDDSQYYELYSSISFDDWLTFSARLADTSRAHSITDGLGKYSWEENRSNLTQTFKIEASRATGIDSGIRFTGYYTNSDLNLDIIDKAFEQSERSIYGELIYDQSFFSGDGLLTTGVSWRESTFSDILVWKSFMPNYLGEDNTELLPFFETEDYDNALASVFTQYRHKFHNIELWAGVRNDDHDRFEDEISYSFGGAWTFLPDFIFKAIHGTAYRTPSARFNSYDFVKNDLDTRLERINSTNVQLVWKPGKGRTMSLTLFNNEIEDHVIEDGYSGAGLSSPNSQTISGAELEWDFRITDAVSVSGNVTSFNNSGSDETYYYASYDYKLNETSGLGESTISYTGVNYDYDAGADTMVNLAMNWKLTPNIILVPELQYLSKVQSHYLNEVGQFLPFEITTIESSDVWLMDVHLKIKEVFPFCVDLFVENLLDEQYMIPGKYSLIDGKSFRAGLIIKKTW